MQLRDYRYQNSSIRLIQSDFRKLHSCTMTLFPVVYALYGLDQRDYVILVLLDFSRDIDRIDHNKLFAIFINMGLSQYAVQNTKQKIRIS